MKTKRIVALLLIVVMLFAFTACKKNAGVGENAMSKADILYASFNWASENAAEKDSYTRDSNRFVDMAMNDIGLTEAKAKALLDNTDTWSVYTIDIVIHNNSATSKTFIGFAATGLPEGMWLNTVGSFELTVPSKVTDEVYPVGILVDNTLFNKVEIYNALSKMNLELVYFETPADGSDEVPESEYKKYAVTNNIVAPSPDTQSDDQIISKRVSIEDGSAFLESARNNPTAFNSEAKLFGLDSATAAKVIADGSTWKWCVLNIEIENKTDTDLNIYEIIAENNGKNGVWVCSVSQYGEFGMPANDKQILPVNVLVDTAAIGDKSAEEAIAAVKIQLEYFTGEYDEDMIDEDSVVKNFITVK